MKATTKELPELIERTLKVGLCPMIHGSPALGKSTIVKEIANKRKLKLIDIRLSQSDPTDLAGIPMKEDGKATFLPFDTFPIEGDKVPEGYNGWLIFCDELNSASKAVIAAAYKLILDREVGQHSLHKKAYVCAAGNLMTDGAIVNKMSTAMQSRLVHFELTTNYKDWTDWGYDNGIDTRIIKFIEFRPDLLNKFNPKHNNYTYPSPRTWEFASKLIAGNSDLTATDLTLLAGAVDEGAAREFYSFTKIYNKLQSIEQIIAEADTIAIPDDPATLYATTGMLVENLTTKTADKLMKYIVRLPVEFGLITVIPALKRNPELNNNQSLMDWKINNLANLI